MQSALQNALGYVSSNEKKAMSDEVLDELSKTLPQHRKTETYEMFKEKVAYLEEMIRSCTYIYCEREERVCVIRELQRLLQCTRFALIIYHFISRDVCSITRETVFANNNV
jgi:hypothetical protein